jgi:hypothetical protein
MPTQPTATQTKSTFVMECAVTCRIQAPPERVWSLLTNAAAFPKWNSTVTRLDGRIETGRKLAIEVPSAPGRVFRPTVSAFEPTRRMVWSDGIAPMFRGVRTFMLAPAQGGATDFSMAERFSGVMLPLIKGSLPDFGPIFEAYACDLKRAAEAK